MFTAARNCDVEEMKRLLDQGADINAQRNGSSVIAIAIDFDAMAVIRFMVKHPDFKPSGLHAACLNRRPWIVEALLARGADPFARDSKGNMPMYLLRGDWESDLKIVQLILTRPTTDIFDLNPEMRD